MKYAIVTVQFLTEKGIVVSEEWRHSLDGLSVIVHEEKILPVLTAEDNITMYEFDSPELAIVLSGSEWSLPKEELV